MPLFDKVCYNMRGVKSDSRKIEYNKIEYIRLRKADSNQKYKEILNQVYEEDKGFFDIVNKYTSIL